MAVALDVTIAPLVDLWGFGPEPERGREPSGEELAAARARVGLGRLEVRDEPPALRKHHPALCVDLSAVAKGFAVDALAELLEVVGATDFLVEVGGEVRAHGERPGGGGWRLAIERPEPDGRAVQVSALSCLTSTQYVKTGL